MHGAVDLCGHDATALTRIYSGWLTRKRRLLGVNGNANNHLAPPARAAGSDQAPLLDSSLDLVSATHLLRPPAGTGGAIATDVCSRNLGMMTFLFANLISLLLMLVMTIHKTSFPFPQGMGPSMQASALSALCAGMSVSTAFGVREGVCRWELDPSKDPFVCVREYKL